MMQSACDHVSAVAISHVRSEVSHMYYLLSNSQLVGLETSRVAS